jgi:hypothetical protein
MDSGEDRFARFERNDGYAELCLLAADVDRFWATSSPVPVLAFRHVLLHPWWGDSDSPKRTTLGHHLDETTVTLA